MRTKQFRTTILIDADKPPRDDHEWLKQRKFKPTSLLRSKIKELRKIEDGAPTIEGLQENMDNLRHRLESLCKILEEVLSQEQFKEIMQKI